jgi:hypothetical protein
MIRTLLSVLMFAGVVPASSMAQAQSSPTGTVMQAQTENLIVMPANKYYVDFNRVVTTLPTDSTPKFYYDVRAMAYVTGASGATTCRVGLSDDYPGSTPLIFSPVVDVPNNATVAIPLEYVGYAFAGKRLTLTMQFISGPAPLNIERWTSITAEVVPYE